MNEITYDITIGNNFLVREHIVFGHYIMPTDGLLEMVYVGAQSVLKHRRLSFSEVYISSPLTCVPGYVTQVKNNLRMSNGTNTFLVSSKIPGIEADFRNNMGGIISTHNRQMMKGDSYQHILRGDNQNVDSSMVYSPHQPFQVGDFYKSIREIRIRGSEAVGTLQISNKAKRYQGQFLLHPGILDGVFGVAAMLAGSLTDLNGSKTFLPVYIDKIDIFKELYDELYTVYIVATKADHEFIRLNVCLMDKQDNAVVSFHGLDEKKVDAISLGKHLSFAGSVTPSSEKSVTGRLNSEDRLQLIKNSLRKWLGETLKMDENRIGFERNLIEQGLDSILSLQFLQKINREYGLSLQGTVVFEQSTLNALSKYLVEKAGDRLNPEEGSSSLNISSQDITSHKARNITPKTIRTEIYRPFHNGDQEKDIDRKAEVNTQEIAIIGMAGRFPGSDNLEELWENLIRRKYLIREIPEDHWDFRPWYIPGAQEPNKIYCNRGGFIHDVDKFDPLFFKISPREAKSMDPQLRLFLQVLWEAIENAGYGSRMKGTRTGLYLGNCFNDYLEILMQQPEMDYQFVPLGNSNCMLSNRAAYFLDLRGPCLTLDTACSSSLVALHLACQALRAGDCSMAIVGGVNLSLSPRKYLNSCALGVYSKTGQISPFDQSADGFLSGEGIAALLLKPLTQAVKDKDIIHGIIKGTSVSSAGRAPGLTVPNVDQETHTMVNAWKNANINPETLSYIEAHGTGTRIGDPLEINAIKNAFSQFTGKEHFCVVGSIKANIGHTEATAGIAGIIKVLLQMKYKKIPGLPRLRELNNIIEIHNSPLSINRENMDWNTTNGAPRRAGVSSFGLGGTYAHVVLEEHNEPVSYTYLSERDVTSPHVIVLSARNRERLKAYAYKLLSFLMKARNGKAEPDGGEQVLLSGIAYTLQVGREAMSERLAFVVSSMSELLEGLECYGNGGTDIKNLFCGSIKDNALDTASIPEREEGRPSLDSLIHDRNLTELARLWVSGQAIKWELLYSEDTPKLISLPAYPFDKKRYWISDKVKSAEEEVQVLHPLLDRLDDPHSSQSGFVFHKLMRVTDLIVRDHKVNGRCIFPAVGYLEMVFGAMVRIKRDVPCALRGVVWCKPLEIRESGQFVTLQILEKDEEFLFNVRSGTSFEVEHSRGVISFKDDFSKAQDQSLSIDTIKSRCPRQIDNSELYKLMNEAGIAYGAYFRGLVKIWASESEALGLLNVPQEFVSESEQYTLPPTLADGALQIIAALVGWSSERARGPMVPFAVEEVEVLHPLKATCYAHVKCVGKDVFNVFLSDESGVVCVKFREVNIRELNDPLQKFFYVPGWELDRLSPVQDNKYNTTEAKGADKGTILLIYPPESLGIEKALASACPDDTVFEIKLGYGNRRLSEKCREIKTDDPFALDQCIEEFLPNKSENVTIYFLGGIHTGEIDPDDLESLERIQEFGVITLFRLIKSLSKYGIIHPFSLSTDQKKTIIKVITNDVRQILPAERTRPYSACMHGFCKSVIKEYPLLEVSCIDISTNDLKSRSSKDENEKLIASIINEPGGSNGEEVAIRKEGRYVRVVEWVQMSPVSEVPFRYEGVYLILGGAGGIGLALSGYLSETVKARLVLLGRRELSAGQREKISELETKGGKVLYLQADATDEASMQAALENAKSHFGKINGVIHSAIVLKDKTIEMMDEDALSDALAPKVRGSVVLYKVFKEEPLDFMLFFSSVQSFIGNAGQSNYAAACTFKDAFARYLGGRVSYPVKVINWGYWGSVGIVASKVYLERMAAQGIGSITPLEGIEAIQRVLVNNVDQVIVIKAEAQALKKMNFDVCEPVNICPERYPSLMKEVERRIVIPGIETRRVVDYLDNWREVELWSRGLLLEVFQKLGVFRRSGERYGKKELMERLGIKAGYRRLYEALLTILAGAGFIQLDGETVLGLPVLDEAGLQNELRALSDQKSHLVTKSSELEPHIELLWVCLRHYADILRGKVPATDILFPNASMELVERVYKGSVVVDYFNSLVAQSVLAFIEMRLPYLAEDERIRILEVGAGTGGTSAFVLEAIRRYGKRLEYVYTDLSSAFIQYGNTVYGDRYPFIKFKIMDIEKEGVGQGYGAGVFDVIIASNALHATRRLDETLQNIKSLLKTNGWLILNELMKVEGFLTMTFGLLEGWWLFEDAANRLPDAPLVSIKGWKRLLKEAGFECVRTFGLKDLRVPGGQQVVLAESNGRIKHGRRDAIRKVKVPDSMPAPSLSKKDPGTVMRRGIVQEDNEMREAVAATILGSVASVLEIDQQEFDLDAPYTDFGVDSISAVDIINRINSDLSIQLKSTDLFNYSTIRKLIDHIIEMNGRVLSLSGRNGSHGDVEAEINQSRGVAHLPPLDSHNRKGGKSIKRQEDEILTLFRKIESGDIGVEEAALLLEKKT